MRGKPIFLAASLARLVADELHLRGAMIEILGFTTVAWKGGRTRERWVAKGRPDNPGRLNELRHIVYHSGQEIWGDAGHRKISVMLREGLLKENIDGEALAWAYRRSLTLPGVRRAIILISDGAPVDDSTLSKNPGDYLERHLRSIIEAIEDHSLVGLGALGIGHDVSRYFKKSFSCAELGEVVPHQVIRLVEQILLPRST
jgi:cobaltochelatase CobT